MGIGGLGIGDWGIQWGQSPMPMPMLPKENDGDLCFNKMILKFNINLKIVNQ